MFVITKHVIAECEFSRNAAKNQVIEKKQPTWMRFDEKKRC